MQVHPCNDQEAGEPLDNVCVVQVLLLDLNVGLEHVVQHDCHRVVQQRLAEHHNVQHLVHLYNKSKCL